MLFNVAMFAYFVQTDRNLREKEATIKGFESSYELELFRRKFAEENVELLQKEFNKYKKETSWLYLNRR